MYIKTAYVWICMQFFYSRMYRLLDTLTYDIDIFLTIEPIKKSNTQPLTVRVKKNL